MVLGADRLDVNNLSIERAKAIEQATDIGDYGLHAGTMPFAAFHLHVDDD
jgi:hypothetical protein